MKNGLDLLQGGMIPGKDNMKVHLTELRIIANNFLETLRKEGIISSEDLESRVGSSYHVSEDIGDSLAISERPSNAGTTALTLSYIRERAGIPVEIKINKTLGYSQIIVKTQTSIRGYSVFGSDTNQNIMQSKRTTSTSLDDLKEELLSL